MCRSRSDIELFVGLCRSQNNVGLFIGIILDGAGHSETRLEFHFEVKFLFFIYLDLFSFSCFALLLAISREAMAEVNQSTVKSMGNTVNIHQSKINAKV